MFEAFESAPMSSSSSYLQRQKTLHQQMAFNSVAYNRIRARLFHSQELLSGTHLTLYNLNEKQISLWFENKTRCEEVVTLLQGWSLPGATETAGEPLPEPRKRQRIVSLAPPIKLKEPEDRSGQAKIRRRGVSKTVLPVS
eukprot:gene14857-16401_t